MSIKKKDSEEMIVPTSRTLDQICDSYQSYTVSEPKYATTRLLKECFRIFNINVPTHFNFDEGGTIPLESPAYIFLDDEDQDERRCYLLGADINGKQTEGVTFSVDQRSGNIKFIKGFTSYQRNESLLGDFHIYSSVEEMSRSQEDDSDKEREESFTFYARVNLYQVLGSLYNFIMSQAFSKMDEKVHQLKYDETNYDWNKGYEVTFQTKSYSKATLTKKWENHKPLSNIEEFGK